VRCTSSLHDDPLISGTESPIEAGQRGLDEPRFESHPCGLAVGIEFPSHSQRHQCICDAPWCHNHADDAADKAVVCAESLLGLLDHGQSCASRGPITFKSAFAEMKQERLGRRDTKTSSGNDFDFGPNNSLFLRQNSLFRQNNFLFCCVGNLAASH